MAASQLGLGNPTDLFWCPIEGGDRTYETVTSGRIGSLLARVDPERFDSESLLRCTGCDTTFDSAVLDVLTNHEMVKRIDLAARALFGSLIRATPADQDVRAEALDAMRPYLVRPGSVSDLIDVNDVSERDDPLRDVVDVLDDGARQLMLQRAIEVSVSGGRIRARHLGVLVQAGEALGISQKWIRSRIVEQRRST